jgi:hypothetical protein
MIPTSANDLPGCDVEGELAGQRPAERRRGARVGGVRCVVLLTAIAAILAAMPTAADAATVAVRPNPDSAFPEEGDFEPSEDEVHYVAAPGERNRLVVAYAGDAESVTVSDPGAIVTPGESCTAVDLHTVRCLPRPGGLSPFLQAARAELGDLDDEVRTTRPGPAPIGGVRANGGPGDDRLFGASGDDVLDGGGGRDELHGGADFDVLTDGDVDGAAGDAGPGADVLDGGGGIDEVSYAQRSAGVDVRLADEAPDGAIGEGDVVRGFERVTGGGGDDRLVGTREVNTLAGGGGDDVLVALGGKDSNGFGDRLDGGDGGDRLDGGDGPDSLTPGPGTDRVECRRGRDVVHDPQGGELLGRACEQIRYDFGAFDENSLAFSPHPTRTSPADVTFRLACPDFEELDGEPASCRGTVTLREARGARRVLGRGRIADAGRRDTFDVRIGLTKTGRRRAARPGGVATTVSIRGRNLPAVRWTIPLRVRR